MLRHFDRGKPTDVSDADGGNLPGPGTHFAAHLATYEVNGRLQLRLTLSRTVSRHRCGAR
jgi:hypothetical protein